MIVWVLCDLGQLAALERLENSLERMARWLIMKYARNCSSISGSMFGMSSKKFLMLIQMKF